MRTATKGKRFVVFLVAVFSAIAVLLLSTVEIRTAQAEFDDVASVRSLRYIQEMYIVNGIEYNNVDVISSVDLYDDMENVIATAVLFDRDESVDYAVYNHITESIDEYGFDDQSRSELFGSDKRLYYAGPMNYIEGGISAYGLTEYDAKIEGLRTYRQFAERRLQNEKEENSSTFAYVNGDEGIIDWSALIKSDVNNGYFQYESDFIKGVVNTGATGGLSFRSTSSFPNNGINCGPTALTNIMIYLNWRDGKNTLYNSSVDDTFLQLYSLSKCDSNGTTDGNAKTAIVEYLYNRGYTDVGLMGVNNDIEAYKSTVKKGHITFTSLWTIKSDLHYWGHDVLTLGYQRMHSPKTDKYIDYIRVCDGWSSCNSGRFIDIDSAYHISSAAVYFGSY